MISVILVAAVFAAVIARSLPGHRPLALAFAAAGTLQAFRSMLDLTRPEGWMGEQVWDRLNCAAALGMPVVGAMAVSSACAIQTRPWWFLAWWCSTTIAALVGPTIGHPELWSRAVPATIAAAAVLEVYARGSRTGSGQTDGITQRTATVLVWTDVGMLLCLLWLGDAHLDRWGKLAAGGAVAVQVLWLWRAIRAWWEEDLSEAP